MRLMTMRVDQVRAYFEQHDAVMLAIGSIENHGAHNVLGVDTMIPDYLLTKIERASDVLIAPTIPYGACDSLTGYPGTVSLGTDGLYHVVKKVVDGLYAHGARRFLFLNGHGGNIGVLDQVGLEMAKKGALCAQLNWWLMVWDMNPRWKGGHGGAEETAAMLAIDPSLVDRSKIADMALIHDLGDELPTAGFKAVKFKGVEIPVSRGVHRFTENGWIGPDHPAEAEAGWGEEMLTACADYIVEFTAAFARAPLPM